MKCFTDEAVMALESRMRADPTAAFWCVTVAWSVFDEWTLEDVDYPEAQAHWHVSWNVPDTTDARKRLTLPTDEAKALANYLREFQVAHVAATDALFDSLTYRFRVERHRTELSII